MSRRSNHETDVEDSAANLFSGLLGGLWVVQYFAFKERSPIRHTVKILVTCSEQKVSILRLAKSSYESCLHRLVDLCFEGFLRIAHRSTRCVCCAETFPWDTGENDRTGPQPHFCLPFLPAFGVFASVFLLVLRYIGLVCMLLVIPSGYRLVRPNGRGFLRCPC